MSQATFTDGLGYEGKVTLTLKSNNRIIKSKTYKNNGTARLFQFLGFCLMGSFAEAETLVPNRILLLRNDSDSPVGANATKVTRSSAWQGFAQAPTIISDSKTAQVRVTYNFEVPNSSIIGPFNQVALYSAAAGDLDIANFSAYHYLTDNDGAFEMFDKQYWSATTILLIEWELSLSNKNIETNNT